MAQASRKQKAGLPPGSLIHMGEKPEKVTYAIFDYNEEHISEIKAKDVAECIAYKKTKSVTWIDVSGLDAEAVGALAKAYDIHPLIQEDILSTDQRPKFEEFDDYAYIVVRLLSLDKKHVIKSEQISLILGQNFVLSFQETEGDPFDPVRERIRKSKGRLRKSGPDYLAYALLDAIIDGYFGILEELGEEIERLDEAIAKNSNGGLQRINRLKKSMINIRRAVWPLRDVVNAFQRSESPFVKKQLKPYLRDLYDHTVSVMDSVESYREQLASLLDLYLSSISNRMNEVMKVLTIIATIFIPLTFISGIYGMNFQYMPELTWRYGYYLIIGIMVAVTMGMLYYFRRKGWL